MPSFRFGVLYEHNGPTLSEPFRQRKSAEQVANAIERFVPELPRYFAAANAIITAEDSVSGKYPLVVCICCEWPEWKVVEAVKRCLNGLDLYGEQL
jgi:hypothetical protein